MHGHGSAPAEEQFLLVAPQHRRPGLDCGFAEHVVQINDLIASFVAHNHKQRAMPGLHAVLHQRAHATVYFLPHGAKMQGSGLVVAELGSQCVKTVIGSLFGPQCTRSLPV